MNQAFDETSVRILLRRMIDRNYITLQDLDHPSRGWVITMEDAKRIPGFTPPTYRNLLRDEPTPTERVEIVSPRDFAVAETVADPVQRGSAPVLPRTDWEVAEPFSDAGLQGSEGSVGDEADYGDEAYLGASGEDGTQGVGGFPDDW
jgi:hypothetical protein